MVIQQRVRNSCFYPMLVFARFVVARSVLQPVYSSSRRFKMRNLCLNQDMVRSSASILLCFVLSWPVLGGSACVLVTNCFLGTFLIFRCMLELIYRFETEFPVVKVMGAGRGDLCCIREMVSWRSELNCNLELRSVFSPFFAREHSQLVPTPPEAMEA